VNRGDARRDKNRPGENARPEPPVETEDAFAHHPAKMGRENQASTPCQRDVPAIGGRPFDVSAGRDLPENARVRVAWVAEDVGGLVEPGFIIDETETIAPIQNASARFTLARPPDGWAEGKYRLEFYINDTLTETVNVTIR